MTNDYEVFGGCLRADLALEGVPRSTGGSPEWTLRTTGTAAPAPGPVLGDDHVNANTCVRLSANEAGYQLDYDDTGTFAVSRDGRSIRWHPAAGASAEAAGLDVIGRVLALALHASGCLCLHGSAVMLEKRGLAFLAPKGYGKSTLALALLGAGARLVSDDTIAIEPGPRMMMRPGIRQVRVRDDSAARFAAGLGPASRSPGGKQVLTELPDSLVVQSRLALNAIYVITPVPSRGGGGPNRRRLDAVAAALVLVRHAKLGPLLGAAEAGRLLRAAAAVAGQTAVYALEIPRDLHAVGDTVAQLGEWHRAEAPVSPREDSRV